MATNNNNMSAQNAGNNMQSRWAIKARVTAKREICRYNNARGDGKVFSFDLLDSDGGEIRATCFNVVVDRFHDIIEVGKVYLISKGSLKPTQKNFNHLKNEWDIFLEATSTIDLCPDEDGSIPQQQFSFRPISEIEVVENNSIIDIIDVVISVNPSVPILRKNGKVKICRLFPILVVKAGKVNDFFFLVHRKGRKVNDFSGKSIETISCTQLFINPDSPEAQSLRVWFDQRGKNIASQFISRDMPGGPKNEIRKTVSQIKDEG
ncbi:hypothetical protein ACSBR2_018615 [Camellia fascicularis]